MLALNCWPSGKFPKWFQRPPTFLLYGSSSVSTRIFQNLKKYCILPCLWEIYSLIIYACVMSKVYVSFCTYKILVSDVKLVTDWSHKFRSEEKLVNIPPAFGKPNGWILGKCQKTTKSGSYEVFKSLGSMWNLCSPGNLESLLPLSKSTFLQKNKDDNGNIWKINKI